MNFYILLRRPRKKKNPAVRKRLIIARPQPTCVAPNVSKTNQRHILECLQVFGFTPRHISHQSCHTGHFFPTFLLKDFSINVKHQFLSKSLCWISTKRKLEMKCSTSLQHFSHTEHFNISSSRSIACFDEIWPLARGARMDLSRFMFTMGLC